MEYLYRTLSGIFNNAPLWVWPLLLILVVLGLRETKTRQVNKISFYFLLLISLIGIRGIIGLEHQYYAYISCLVFFSLGVGFGMYFQNEHIMEVHEKKLAVKGEWLTISILLIIYFSNFIKGILLPLLQNFCCNPCIQFYSQL